MNRAMLTRVKALIENDQVKVKDSLERFLQ